MSLAKRLLAVTICTAILSVPLLAVTYVVPNDRALIHSARAIVVGTVVQSRTLISESGGVQTVTTIDLDEVIKGGVLGRFLDVVEPGGEYEGSALVIPGVPRFNDGERVLLMLASRPDGRWVVANLALGKFSFLHDAAGQKVLARNEGEINGWDPQLNVYRERRRGADAFLSFVRSEMEREGSGAEDYYVDAHELLPGEAMIAAAQLRANPLIAPYTATSYTLGNSATSQGARWSVFPSSVTYKKGPTAEPGAAGGGDTAAGRAMSAWSGAAGANISIQYSAVAGSDTGLSGSADGRNTIMFEQDLSSPWGIAPFTCTANSYSGVLGIGGFSSSGTNTHPNGETFGTITDGDVMMNKGLANCTLLFSSGNFNSAVTHEVGHSLGFRHSNQDRTFGSACGSSTMECSSSAIMTAVVTNGLNASLATWDTHAAAAVYPGTTSCTSPSITTQPASTTITSGLSTTLSVVASGTSPTYQWYSGTSSLVAGGTASSLTVSPTSTTSYWVAVTACTTTVNSSAATVTVNPATCTSPSITTQPASTTITAGQSTTLSVVASGTSRTYKWYTGASGNTSSPVSSGGTASSLTVSPTSTTSYWVAVTACSTRVNSSAATVTVNPATCTPPSITTQPSGSTISSGGSAFLSVGASGTTPRSSQWYKGNPLSTALPVAGGTAASISVSPAATTTYWVQVTNSCGTANSIAATVTVTPSTTCTPPAITSISATPTSLTAGAASTLTVVATGSSLNYQWYVGAPGDTSTPVSGGNAATISVAPTQTTSYWVLVLSGCGVTTATSSAVTVTVGAACTAPTITQPANQLIPPGWSVTLTASAAGTAPLQYQWYQGPTGTTTNPLGSSSATFSTGALTSTAQYWVQVTNGCGSTASSGTITITVQPARRRPARR